MGRVIVAGSAEGEILKSLEPINFLGSVDAKAGSVSDASHPLHGQPMAGRILAFPHGAGSSVGAYTVYALAANGVAPAAMICTRADTTVVTGCAVAGIPMAVADAGEFERLRGGQRVLLEDGAAAPA